MSDIDWLAVQMVCEGTRLPLSAAEKRMVIRRVEHRMLTATDNTTDISPGKIRARDLAELLDTSQRNVERVAADLPDADRRRCPVCKGWMWVLPTGVVEEHGDGFHDTCPMTDRIAETVVGLLQRPEGLRPKGVRGLAALRPDLYPWLVSA